MDELEGDEVECQGGLGRLLPRKYHPMCFTERHLRKKEIVSKARLLQYKRWESGNERN